MRQEVFDEWFPAVGLHFAHTHFLDARVPFPQLDLRQQMIDCRALSTRFVKYVGAVMIALKDFAFCMC